MYIYYLPIHSQIWGETDIRLLEFISNERKEKIQKYAHITDQMLSLYAGLLIRMGLSDLSGIPHSKLQFMFKDNHKPCLLSAPSFDFSISHTHTAILCSVSMNESVGSDIEKIINPPYEIMKDVFHPNEIEYIHSAHSSLKEGLFFEIWTRKEAYTKHLGVGLIYDLPSFNTLSSPLSEHLLTWRQDNYICSIYGNNPNMSKIKKISVQDIHNFYLENNI